MAAKCEGGSLTRERLINTSQEVSMETGLPCHFEIRLPSHFLLIFWVFDWPAVTTQGSTKEREREIESGRQSKREPTSTHRSQRPPPVRAVSDTKRETTSPPPKREAKALPLAHGRGHRHRAWDRGGSGGQPRPALQRQENRERQGPAEDRHAAAAAAVEARLGTIEGGFTWWDLWEVGVRTRQPLDQDVAVLVEVRRAPCRDRRTVMDKPRWLKWATASVYYSSCLFQCLISSHTTLRSYIVSAVCSSCSFKMWSCIQVFIVSTSPTLCQIILSSSKLNLTFTALWTCSSHLWMGSCLLTGTWFHATDSDGIWLTVQAQTDGVVPGVAQSLPLLSPITTGHRTLESETQS